MYLYERSQTSYLSHCKPESINQETIRTFQLYHIKSCLSALPFLLGQIFLSLFVCLDFLPFPTVTCGSCFQFPGLGRGFGLFQCGSTAASDDPSENRDERSNWKNFMMFVFFCFPKTFGFFWISNIIFCQKMIWGETIKQYPKNQ